MNNFRQPTKDAFPKPIVYLGGPITGLSYSDADDWRGHATDELAPDILCANPLRNAKHLKGSEEIPVAFKGVRFLSDRCITMQDYFDICRSQLVLMNFLGAPRLSGGSAWEMGVCFERRIPIVMSIEPDGNPHDHPILRETASFRCETLPEALIIVRGLLIL
jgi:hypothetical protein